MKNAARLYAMLAPPGELRLRVLLRHSATAASGLPQIAVHSSPYGSLPAPAMERFTFDALPASLPSCWRGDITVPAASPGMHRVSLSVDGVRVDAVDALVRGPQQAASLRVLLGSCYWYKRLAGGALRRMIDDARRLDRHASVPRPLAFSVLMGDQVYLDLPVSLRRTGTTLVEEAYERYLHQWFDDPDFAALLQAAPVMMIADDHELWNNAPYPQAQIPGTWSLAGRQFWQRLGLDLFDHFQLAPALTNELGRSRFLHSPPMHAAFVDARLSRRADRNTLFSDHDRHGLDLWASELAAAADGSIGLLAIGQPLFDPGAGQVAEKWIDGGLADAPADFEWLLSRLSTIPHPLLVLTGDVHFGRALAMHPLFGHPQGRIVEVVCSPLALIQPTAAALSRDSTSEPSFATNHADFKRHGYGLDPARIGIASKSMLAVLSLDLQGKPRAHVDWHYWPDRAPRTDLRHAELLPALRPH